MQLCPEPQLAFGTQVQVYRQGMDNDNKNQVSADTHRRLAGLETARLAAGAGWGVVATAIMSAVMLTATGVGISPMPKPIPAALVSHTLGLAPSPLLAALAILAHFAYGTVAGAVLAGLVRKVTVWHGIGYGVALWALMDLAWLPYVGWGLFGSAITPKIAVATLVLHLIYGLMLGLLLDRRHGRTGDFRRKTPQTSSSR